MHNAAALILSLFFLLPAIITLFFTWAVWPEKKILIVQPWRRETFRWALLSALGATLLIIPGCLHLARTGVWATGFWLLTNWCSALLWVFGLGGSLSGKGSARILLFSWGILMFLGVLGLDSATIP